MDSNESIRAFISKWHAAWPEQDVLDVFIPVSERQLCSAWGALLFEMHQSLFGLEHESVREAKCQWWSGELLAMPSQSARHPLTCFLQEHEAGFDGMAAPFLALVDLVPVKAGKTEELFNILAPWADAVAVCEASLFRGSANHADGKVVIGQWLTMRLPEGMTAFDSAMVPMHLQARHQALVSDKPPAALRRDWIHELLANLEDQRPSNWYRLAQHQFTLKRLAALLHRDKPKIGPGHAWAAWRALRTRQPV
jgi:hypothetical protein